MTISLERMKEVLIDHHFLPDIGNSSVRGDEERTEGKTEGRTEILLQYEIRFTFHNSFVR